jgi:hypothetical protein
VVSLDSSPARVHPDGTGALKNGEQAPGKSRGGLNTKIPMMVADNRCATGFILSGGEASDASNGRLLPGTIGRIKDPDGEGPLVLLIDRAYEGQETRLLAFEWGIAW